MKYVVVPILIFNQLSDNVWVLKFQPWLLLFAHKAPLRVSENLIVVETLLRAFSSENTHNVSQLKFIWDNTFML